MIMRHLNNVSFILGRNEKVTINCNGQRVSSYALMQINSSGLLEIVSEYHIINKTIRPIRQIVWPNGKIPIDTPICGFDNSLCPCKSTNKNLIANRQVHFRNL